MHLFDQGLDLKQEEPLRFTGSISKNWLINSVANGGYLMALAAKAMLAVSDKRGTPVITANYISRCLPRPLEIEVEEIARSSGFTRLQAGLFQGNREKVRAWGTFVAEKQGREKEIYETGPPEVAALNDCILVPDLPQNTLMENLEMRLDPSCAGWMQGKPSGRSEQKGWFCFRQERPHDLLSVLMLADAIPPPIFAGHGAVTWVPTIELTVNVRNIPRTRWLKFTLRTRFISGNMVEADGEIWDETGILVAISRQIAQVRRNG